MMIYLIVTIKTYLEAQLTFLQFSLSSASTPAHSEITLVVGASTHLQWLLTVR